MGIYTGTDDPDVHVGREEEMYGGAGNDRLTGTRQSAQHIYGGAGDDLLEGAEAGDFVHGNGGSDDLDGGLGNDLLKGGGGSDGFNFSTRLGHVNVDTIVDFKPAAGDKIGLYGSKFAAIGPAFEPGEFVLGKRAHDADDRIIYQQSKGKLFFDHDGAGGDSKVLFAVVQNHAHLGFGDIDYFALV